MNRFSLNAVFFLATFFSTLSNSAVVNYSEGINGDLAGSWENPTDVGQLDLGLNVISGASSFRDLDGFSFSLLESHKLTNILFIYDSVMLTPRVWGVDAIFRFWENDDDASFLFNVLEVAGDNPALVPSPILATALPLTNGTNRITLEHTVFGLPAGFFDAFEYNYSFSLLVEPSAVPIPTAAWLFGSSLIGLALARRRK